MDAVTFRAMRRKQREYLTLHRHIANDVIAEAVKRGKIPKMVFLPGEKKLVKPQDAYTIKVDPVSKREMSAIVTQLVGLASSMPLFEDLQYIQKSEAREVVRHVIGEIVELRDSTVNDDKLGPEVRKVFTPERMQQLRKIDEALREAA